MDDWPTAIASMLRVKAAIFELDQGALWDYRGPRTPATADQIQSVESALRRTLDPEHRAFLRWANGWPCFWQTVDLLGTDELIAGTAAAADGGYGPYRWTNGSYAVAFSTQSQDVFVVDPENTGSAVRWQILGGDRVDEFSSFDEYFRAMLDYNRMELRRLQENPALLDELRGFGNR